MMWPEPVTLEGSLVRLEVTSQAHLADLKEASADGELHKLWYTPVPHPDAMADEIERRLGLMAQQTMLPFSIVQKESGKAVGMTTYMNIVAAHRRLEIGHTWYRPAVQRSGLNTECKLLLLSHAFETLDCIAVEFRTHFMNRQSRAAIERLGAKLDGVLRSHMFMPDGSLRDTAVYSILAHEWPAVKAGLEFSLKR
ncbi:MAG: GNAT family protein [Pseudomonadota bacterium]